MRSQKPRPWLTSTGVEISTEQLKEVSKAWNNQIWNDYLSWYDSALCARLVEPPIYEGICDELTESLFERFNQETCQNNRAFCEHLLATLPSSEASVLRLAFFEGRTVRDIAALRQISKSGVHDIKTRALLRLRRGHQGDISDTREFMRGKFIHSINEQASIWTAASPVQLKEAKVYRPDKQKEEFEKIKHEALKLALTELSERQQRIIYLRYWCEYSMNDIGRDLRCGANLAEQVCEAALSKLKRKIVQFECGYAPGGGPSCA